MPVGPVTRSWGGSPDRRALVTERGVNEGIGCTLVAANFSNATYFPAGVVPALTAIVVDSAGLASPVLGTASAPLSGFTLNDANVSQGNEVVAYMSRGDLDPTLLPVSAFVAATTLAADKARFKFDAKA